MWNAPTPEHQAVSPGNPQADASLAWGDNRERTTRPAYGLRADFRRQSLPSAAPGELPGDALSAGPAGPIGRAIQLGSRVDGLPASTGDEPGPDDVADGACPWTPTVPLAPYWNR